MAAAATRKPARQVPAAWAMSPDAVRESRAPIVSPVPTAPRTRPAWPGAAMDATVGMITCGSTVLAESTSVAMPSSATEGAAAPASSATAVTASRTRDSRRSRARSASGTTATMPSA